jgi:hypothetical protein
MRASRAITLVFDGNTGNDAGRMYTAPVAALVIEIAALVVERNFRFQTLAAGSCQKSADGGVHAAAIGGTAIRIPTEEWNNPLAEWDSFDRLNSDRQP